MPKRSSKPKRPRDPNQLARLITDIATGEAVEAKESKRAIAGRIGGKKGGVSRMAALTEIQRKELAKKAANKRWGKGRAQNERAAKP